MKVKINGYNYWGSIRVYLHSALTQHNIPTPFSVRDIYGAEINSRLLGESFPEQEIELQRGDYVMMLDWDEVKIYKEHACGHLYYFNGYELRSVYTNRIYEPKEANYEV